MKTENERCAFTISYSTYDAVVHVRGTADDDDDGRGRGKSVLSAKFHVGVR